jgi:hypothetical protein
MPRSSTGPAVIRSASSGSAVAAVVIAFSLVLSGLFLVADI